MPNSDQICLPGPNHIWSPPLMLLIFTKAWKGHFPIQLGMNLHIQYPQ